MDKGEWVEIIKKGERAGRGEREREDGDGGTIKNNRGR
jgi:hypothetical protein